MSRRTEITDVIMGLLQDQIPEVHWSSLVTGASRGNKLEGTVSCDRITYVEMTKSGRKGVLTYSIYLLDTASIVAQGKADAGMALITYEVYFDC